jgi:hypothetical protein
MTPHAPGEERRGDATVSSDAQQRDRDASPDLAPMTQDTPVEPGERPGELPVRIRPAVAVVLAVGAILAGATFFFDPSPTVRYGIVGVIAVLYFVTKIKYWL